jgi:GntR family transcriptional regulator of vanillate catabolism
MSSEPNTGTHAQRALITLRQKILAGAMSGGTRLFEVALAEELEISRTPVRAALSQLAEEGLLDRARGGGFVVRTFALADVVDTIELRGVLEGTAARFAAERGAGPDEMAGIEAICGQLDDCVSVGPMQTDLALYSRLNGEFHAHLSVLSGSPVLMREIERVTKLPFASPSAFLADQFQIDSLRKSLPPAQEQHKALLDAIRRREGARAESIAREHSRPARRNVEYIFATDPDLRATVPSLALIAS